MLKGINPILIGDLLKVLSDMGHGDEIVIADGWFAATDDSMRRPPIWVPSANTIEVVSAILDVFPVDDSKLEDALCYITETWDTGSESPSVAADEFVQLVKEKASAQSSQLQRLPRKQFHERAKRAYVIVATVDPRHYACFILRKGVLPDPTV